MCGCGGGNKSRAPKPSPTVQLQQAPSRNPILPTEQEETIRKLVQKQQAAEGVQNSIQRAMLKKGRNHIAR